MTLSINQATIDLIKHFESLHDGDLSRVGLQPKMDCIGIWTVGYGHAVMDAKGNYCRGSLGRAEAYRQYDTLTEAQAERLLADDLAAFSADVERLLLMPVSDNEFGAMVSLAYNIGINAFAKSSVLRYFNQDDLSRAADAFLLWNKGTVNGRRVILPGLVRRRQAERLLFLHD